MIKMLTLDSLGQFKGKKAFRETCGLLLRTGQKDRGSGRDSVKTAHLSASPGSFLRLQTDVCHAGH